MRPAVRQVVCSPLLRVPRLNTVFSMHKNIPSSSPSLPQAVCGLRLVGPRQCATAAGVPRRHGGFGLARYRLSHRPPGEIFARYRTLNTASRCSTLPELITDPDLRSDSEAENLVSLSSGVEPSRDRWLVTSGPCDCSFRRHRFRLRDLSAAAGGRAGVGLPPVGRRRRLGDRTSSNRFFEFQRVIQLAV